MNGLLWNARMLESLVFNIKLYKNKGKYVRTMFELKISQTYNLQLSYSIIGMRVGCNQCLLIFDF
jgi:hypothetical protein